MDIRTHKQIDQDLCGIPLILEKGFSRVELLTTEKMAVDDSGLIHGGFVFGLADYAAMIAVNHPNVVLGAAEVKFLKPLKVNDMVVAEASIDLIVEKKQRVNVLVKRGDEKVFEGVFNCFVLDQHVLSQQVP
jgi:acyl-coenzyme A thioesterase PaaI-like protein